MTTLRDPAARSGAAGLTLSSRDFLRLSAFIEEGYGIRMPPTKKALLESRLAQRVRALALPSFSAYCDHVLSGRDRAELVQLVDRVTTNKTDFFREDRHFELLVREALPALAHAHGAGVDRELRLWSAGCSTGEEPYTLAMVLAEAAERTPSKRFEILATDLSSRVLHHAQEGIYAEALVQPIPLPLRRKYLQRSVADPGVVRVRRGLRERIHFRQLNLLDRDPGIAPRMDVVFCRNVLIYFDRQVQAEILGRLLRTLVDGGYLFLGHSESVTGLDLPIDQVAPTVYRKRPAAPGEGPRP
jgi:chemotaxis protein methyltransferase CheR